MHQMNKVSLSIKLKQIRSVHLINHANLFIIKAILYFLFSKSIKINFGITPNMHKTLDSYEYLSNR